MMYLLVNLILAVPGAIVVFFSFPCKDLVDPMDVRRQVYWKTNMTELPDNVQAWMQNFEVGRHGGASKESSTFVETIAAIYVFGSYQDQPPQLYVVEEVGVEPKPLEFTGWVSKQQMLLFVAFTPLCLYCKLLLTAILGSFSLSPSSI